MRISSWVLSFLLLFMVSCSSTDSDIKNGLRLSIPVDKQVDYKFVNFQILETVLDVNIKDSITHYRMLAQNKQRRMSSDSIRLKSIQRNIDECEYNRATTLSYLRSSFTSIIRDYEKMKADIEKDLHSGTDDIKAYSKIIEQYEDALQTCSTPIIYYKIKHIYTIKGMRREETATLDYKFKPIN